MRCDFKGPSYRLSASKLPRALVTRVASGCTPDMSRPPLIGSLTHPKKGH